MLIELGVPFDLVLVDIQTDDHRRPEYLRLNPKGVVPTLVIDGTPRAECAALLMLLAERHPERGFAPSQDALERAAYVEGMVYLANTLLPAFRAWFYTDDYASGVHQDDVREHARRRIEAVFDDLDARLADGRTYLLGDRLTAFDFLATMLARWSRAMPRRAETWPRLDPYLARMKAMPSLRETHAREGLTEWID